MTLATRASQQINFENLVFAGGGNRCFWQAGFWYILNKELDLKPKHIASVSAGSAISCAIFAGCMKEALEITKEVMSRNRKNRYLKNLLNNKPVHPHHDLYREIIFKTLSEKNIKLLHKGPLNHILVAHTPRWMGPKTAVITGLLAYQLEKKVRQSVHPILGQKLGFVSEFIQSKDCQTIESLCDALISSSCTPPFTPVMYRGQSPVLDGGIIDNVPVHGIEAYQGNTLILLSRPYKSLPKIPGRTYVQPSKPLEIQSWDYTNPQGVQATYNQGLEDGLNFLKQAFSQ